MTLSGETRRVLEKVLADLVRAIELSRDGYAISCDDISDAAAALREVLGTKDA